MAGLDDDRLRLLAESVGEVFWIADRDLSRFEYVSPAFERIWGTTSTRALVEAIHPDDRARVAGARTSGAPFEHEYRIVTADNTTRWILERGGSSPTSTIAIAQDITESKQIVSERDAIIERFQIISSALKEGVWDWDVANDRVWWSDVIYSMFTCGDVTPGYDTWVSCIHPDDRERVISKVRNVLDSGLESWTDEYRFVRTDGVVLQVRDRGFVIFDDNRKPIHLIGVCTDITQQRNVERQLLHAQKMEAVGALAGGIAHDFNNMLQAVLLELALVQAEPGVPAAALSHVAEIRSALDRATSLTRQLLVFSRREAMRPRRIDLTAKVADLARMLRRVLGEDIVLDIDLSSDPIPAEVDPGMIDQILLNLALNARDALHERAVTTPTLRRTLSITTKLHDAAGTATRPPGRYACVTFEDNGAGIPADVLPRIFDPFFTTKEGKGTGLGLSTVHGIVEQHGGWIDIDSELGRGSTFRVYLPVLTDTTPTRSSPTPPTAHAPSKQETILVVEDDAAVRRAVCQLLEHHGYGVIEADCGSSALASWDSQRGNIDVVLTDLVMPGGMNGRELADRLVARRPDIKIILATGYGRDLDRADLHHNCKLIYKPIDADQLLDTIRTSIDG